MNNKEEQIKEYVMIGTIIMLLVIFSGITYAFFSASNNKGSTSLISAISGKMTINYADGKSDLLVSNDIQPSDAILVNKTFTLTGTNTTSGLAMTYKVGLKYTSTFSDGQIHYYIKEMNRPDSSKVTVEYTGTTNQTLQGNSSYIGYSHGTLKNGNNYTEMVTGEFPVNTSNQPITFNLILQFPDTGKNQDSEKGKEIGGRVVVNYEQPKATTFAEDSWSTIAAVVKDGQLNAYSVGDEKEVVLTDGKSYTVRVANNTTPEECKGPDFSQTACGFVVEFVDIIEQRTMGAYGNAWDETDVRTYLNGDFFNKLPTELQDLIIYTNAVSNNAGNGTTSTTDKVYLLSPAEIFDGLTGNDADKTRQLDYYKKLGVTTANYEKAIKKYNDTNSPWWLRSYYKSSYTLLSNPMLAMPSLSSFYYVTSSGNYDYENCNEENTYGISPAFRIG